MRPSAAIHAFGWGVLASCFVSGQVSELPPLRPVVGGADGLTGDAGADPEPEPQNPKDCHFWQYCWKLTVPITLGVLFVFGLCIIGSFYALNKCCCEIDDEEQRKRYEELKAKRREREAREAAEEAAANSSVQYQSAPSGEPSALPYSQGGRARPYRV